jgi:hypothetical protein
MRTRSSYLLSFAVWLTSITTLWAGAPISVCICPYKSAECCTNADLPAQSDQAAVAVEHQNTGYCRAKPNEPTKQKPCCNRAAASPSAGATPKKPRAPVLVATLASTAGLERQSCQRGTLVAEPKALARTEFSRDHAALCQFDSTVDQIAQPTTQAAHGIWLLAFVRLSTPGLSMLLQRLTI